MPDLSGGWETLLGAGAAGTLMAVWQIITNWRESSWRRADSAVNDLERWRRDADDAREWEAAQHQWWMERAGELEYQILTRLGPDALPPKQPYPQRRSTERTEAVKP